MTMRTYPSCARLVRFFLCLSATQLCHFTEMAEGFTLTLPCSRSGCALLSLWVCLALAQCVSLSLCFGLALPCCQFIKMAEGTGVHCLKMRLKLHELVKASEDKAGHASKKLKDGRKQEITDAKAEKSIIYDYLELADPITVSFLYVTATSLLLSFTVPTQVLFAAYLCISLFFCVSLSLAGSRLGLGICPSTSHSHNHTLTHSYTLLITCTCCYDQNKGTQDKDFSYSFSDSLSLAHTHNHTLTYTHYHLYLLL